MIPFFLQTLSLSHPPNAALLIDIGSSRVRWPLLPHVLAHGQPEEPEKIFLGKAS
jgi:hypothetical protein